MSFESINNILLEKLRSIDTLPPLQTENTQYSPANAPAWCRATLLPSATTIESIGVDGRKKAQGLFQVDLFYINNSGWSGAMKMADTIITAFSNGLYLTNMEYLVLILRSYIDPARQYPNYYQMPVLIEWETFV